MRTLGSQTIRESVYYGALHGIVVWVVYATVEFLFSYMLPWFVEPRWSYLPLHWGYMALLFCIYSVVGMILGGVFILGFRLLSGKILLMKEVQASTFISSIATLTVVLFFALNFVIQNNMVITNIAFLFISLLLAIGLIMSAMSGLWLSRLGFFVNPWTISILLLGLSWITLDQFSDHSKIVKAGLNLTYLIVVLLISFIIYRKGRVRSVVKPAVINTTSMSRSFIFLVPVIFVVLGINLFFNILDQSYYADIQDLKTQSLSANRPNVVLVTMDTVRADHLSVYGYERDTTPNLKEFSKNTTLYTHAIASGSMTLSTHASIFTGMYSRRHGAHYTNDSPDGQPLGKKFHTLAEILSEKGFFTCGVVANLAYLPPRFQLDQGFQYYDLRSPIMFIGKTESYFLRYMLRNICIPFAPRLAWDRWTLDAEEINKTVFALLNKVEKVGEPVFLFVNYMDAHDPYIPPPPFDTLYSGKNKAFTHDGYLELLNDVMRLDREIKEEERNHLVSQYDGAITYIDFQLGKLFERLKELDLYENSLIIITSDHGEAFGERNLVNHAASVYNDQIHIPLIIKYPNVNEGRVIDEPVSVVDFMPTVLDVLGYEVPDEVQGQSLLRLKGRQDGSIILGESYPAGKYVKWHPRFNRIERALYSWPYKFIDSTSGKKELYNLSKDPNELENLYSKGDDVSSQLETRLKQWLKTVIEESASPVNLDKKTIDNLKALGYIQ